MAGPESGRPGTVDQQNQVDALINSFDKLAPSLREQLEISMQSVREFQKMKRTFWIALAIILVYSAVSSVLFTTWFNTRNDQKFTELSAQLLANQEYMIAYQHKEYERVINATDVVVFTVKTELKEAVRESLTHMDEVCKVNKN